MSVAVHQVPFARPEFGDEEARAVAEVLRSGWASQGPAVARFEELFAQMAGTRHAVAVSSCTTALHLALILAGVEPGDGSSARVTVHRDRQRGAGHRRDADFCRHQPARGTSTRTMRPPHIVPNQGDRAGPPGRSGGGSRSTGAAAAGRDDRRRRGVRHRVDISRPAGGFARPHRVLQLSPTQDTLDG